MSATAPAVQGQPGLKGDDDEPGGPARPTPGYLPAEPEPEPGPDGDDDEPGGPAHPAPGHRPPTSPETGSRHGEHDDSR